MPLSFDAIYPPRFETVGLPLVLGWQLHIVAVERGEEFVPAAHTGQHVPLELHLYGLLVPVLGDGPRKYLRTNRTTQSFGIGITRMGGSLSYGIKRFPRRKNAPQTLLTPFFKPPSLE